MNRYSTILKQMAFITFILVFFVGALPAWGARSGYYEWPEYNPTLAYDYLDQYGPLNKPTEVLDDVDNVEGTYIDGWWCFRYGPDKNDLVTSDAWIPMVQRFNEDFDYITNVMRWPRDKRARRGYYSTIYLFGSGMSTDNEPNTATGGWQGTTIHNGEPWPMVLASYVPVAAFDPDRYDGYQTGAMVHEGIHSILSSMPGCKNAAWFHEGGNTWLQGTMEGLRAGDFSSIGWLSAGAMIAPFMPIECYSGWLQDDSFGGPSAEGVNMHIGTQQICTWRNLLGGTQYGECFPHALEAILGPQSIAWIWQYSDQSGRVLQDMAEAEGGLGDVQMRRLIQEYRARQAFCDFGSWSYAFMQLLNNTWAVNIGAEWEPSWIDCENWRATCYAKTTTSGKDLIPETRTLPGWSGANQIPLRVASNATSATVTFNPIGENMICQLVYRDTSGHVHYGVPVESGECSIPLDDVYNNVIVAVICNTDYIYEGESTRTAKFDYTLTMGSGISGKADIYTRWYNYSQSRYQLTATCSANGTLSDTGDISVTAGGSHRFIITPDEGYVIANVSIDGKDIDQVTEYTFHNVRGNHSLHVDFAPPTHSLWASGGQHGLIEPAGEVRVSPGGDQDFSIVPDEGYEVLDVTVDGVSVGAVTEYSFTDVNDDHILLATFLGSSSLVPRSEDLLFACFTDSLPESGSTGNWTTFRPGGDITLSMINTPTVQWTDDVQWVNNRRADGDGYLFGTFDQSIPCEGASIVVVVQPDRHAISDAWNSIVDAFYNDLVLGIHNQSGRIQIQRKGVFFNTSVTIPDGQKTVLSLIVNSDGQFDLYANSELIYSVQNRRDFNALSPGNYGFMHSINVGRNAPDHWSTYNGLIGDVFFYKTALSDNERAELEESLMTKFSIESGSRR